MCCKILILILAQLKLVLTKIQLYTSKYRLIDEVSLYIARSQTRITKSNLAYLSFVSSYTEVVVQDKQ